MAKLTDLSIKALEAPKTGYLIYHDDLTGFGVRVTDKGVKSFVLTHGSPRKRETIGRVGIVSLQDARTAAKRLLAEDTLGKHQPRSKTWNAALEEYLAHVKQKNRASTYKSYKRHLETHFKFTKQMSKLSPADFHDVFGKLYDRPAELHHAFVYVRAFIKWAYRKHYIETNPLERMETPKASKPKERTLTDEELKKVWDAAPNDPFGRIVKLLIILGQRPGEIPRITKLMVKGDLITFPDWLSKNGKQHTFPFPPMAEPYLHDLSYSGFSKAKARLDKVSGVTGWTLHDLRRTLRTNWAKLGIRKDIAERYINHISGQDPMQRVYDRYDYMPEMRAAVAKYSEWLQNLIQSPRFGA